MRVLSVVPLLVDESVTGYVAAQVSLARAEERTTRQAELRFPGVADAVLVVDLEGRILARAEHERGREAPTALLSGLDLAASAGFSGRYVGADGVERIATVQPVGERPLRAIAQEPTTVAYASLTASDAGLGGI